MKADSIFPAWIAGRVEDRVGEVGIVRVVRYVAGIGPVLWRQDAIGKPPLIAENIVQDRLAIDGVSQRLAHANVAQDGIAQIKRQVGEDRARLLLDFKIAILAQSRHSVGAERLAGSYIGA